MDNLTEFAFFGEDFPAIGWYDISPDDNNDLPKIPRAIYIGGDGDIVAVDRRGNQSTFSGAVAGTIIPIQPARIMSTNTTATNLIAIY